MKGGGWRREQILTLVMLLIGMTADPDVRERVSTVRGPAVCPAVCPVSTQFAADGFYELNMVLTCFTKPYMIQPDHLTHPRSKFLGPGWTSHVTHFSADSLRLCLAGHT